MGQKDSSLSRIEGLLKLGQYEPLIVLNNGLKSSQNNYFTIV